MKQNKMKGKLGLFFVLAFVSILGLLVSGAVATEWQEPSLPKIAQMTVYVNGNVAWYGWCEPVEGPIPVPPVNGEIEIEQFDDYTCYSHQVAIPALERGEDMSVKVLFTSNFNLDEVKVKTWLNGYREEIEDQSAEFDVFKGNLYSKTMFLNMPEDIDAKDQYTLHVKIIDQNELNGVDEAKIDTTVQRTSNLLEILSIDFYDHDNFYKGVCGECSVTFQTGTTLYSDIVIKNRGNHVLEDIYVKVSIPDLCMERVVYLGDLGTHDNKYQDTEKITMAFPLPDKEGTYEMVIEAYNSKVNTRETRTIVLEHKVEREIEVLPQITEAFVNQGETAQFSIFVTNLGESYETFVVEVLGADGWSTVKINPASFSLGSGESKIINLNLDVNEDTEAGKYPFTVRVNYGNDAKQFNFTANIEEAGISADWKVILMVIGIVLAIAVIVLLAIMLAKQRSASEEERPETVESYY